MVDESSLQTALALPGFAAPRVRYFEPAGLFYECRLLRDKLTLGEDVGSVLSATALASVLASRSGDSSEEQSRSTSPEPGANDWLDADDAKYEKYLKNLDPSDCNSQDHYKVLGISKLRWRATEGQIRTA
uniref:Uncharacterized protein n=1 Tax=Plectus sambesii TaxID=2011161 RepID=A0A914V5L6_9BILA